MFKKSLIIMLSLSFVLQAQIGIFRAISINGNFLTNTETGDTIATIEWVKDTLNDYVLTGTLTANYYNKTELAVPYAISAFDTNNYRAYVDDSTNVIKWSDTVLVNNKKIITKHDLDTSLANLSFVLGESVLFLHSETTDIPFYNQLLTTAQEDPESTDDTIVNSGDGELLIRSFVTNQLGLNVIPSGPWNFMSFFSVDNATGTTTCVIRVYKRSSGVETELFNVTTSEINGTSVTEYDIETIQEDFAILTTDSLVIKYFAQTTSGVDRTVTLYYEGSSHYTHIHTPIVISLPASGEGTIKGTIATNQIAIAAGIDSIYGTDDFYYNGNDYGFFTHFYDIEAADEHLSIEAVNNAITKSALVYLDTSQFIEIATYGVANNKIFQIDTNKICILSNSNDTLLKLNISGLTVNRKLTANDSSDIKTAMTTWHRNDSINTVITDTWIDIKLDTMIANLSTYGFTTTDSINFTCNTNGIMEINGVINLVNNGGIGTVSSYIRTLKNGSEIAEAKSRINYYSIGAGEESQHELNGRVNIVPGNSLKFQYYVGSADYDYDVPSSVFENEPVIMINIKKVSK